LTVCLNQFKPLEWQKQVFAEKNQTMNAIWWLVITLVLTAKQKKVDRHYVGVLQFLAHVPTSADSPPVACVCVQPASAQHM